MSYYDVIKSLFTPEEKAEYEQHRNDQKKAVEARKPHIDRLVGKRPEPGDKEEVIRMNARWSELERAKLKIIQRAAERLGLPF